MLKTTTHPSLGEVVFHRIRGHISKRSQNKVEDCLLKLNNFPWYFTNNTVYNKPKGLSKFDDISILGHMMIVDGKVTSDYFNALSNEVNIPVIASGGAGSMQHIHDALVVGNSDAVLAASIFHFEELTIQQVKKFLNSKGVSVRL